MSGNARESLRSIVVIGDGPVGWLAAIALRRALPDAAVRIVGVPDRSIPLADRFPVAVASAQPALDLAGLDVDALVAAGVAIHRLGERFVGWGAEPFRTVAVHDEPHLAGATLHHLWLAHGAPGSLAGLTAADALIEQRRFASAAGIDEPDVDPALVLDPARLRDLLRHHAAGSGIERFEGAIRSVDRGTDDRIAALHLSDGRTLTADFHVDTVGAVRELTGAAWVDWSEALPVTMLHCRRDAPSCRLETLWTNRSGGFAARLSMPDADLHLTGASEGDAASGGEGARDRIAIAPGRLVQPHAGNLVAIGGGAACVGPLGLWGFSLALRQIMLLLEMVPARTVEPLLVEDHNRRAVALIDSARDQASLLYHLGRGWTAAASPRLAAALVQFAQRGRLPYRGEDVATEADWVQMLLGLGIRPRRLDPVALSVPAAAARAALAGRRAAALTAAAAMPDYAGWLRARRSRHR